MPTFAYKVREVIFIPRANKCYRAFDLESKNKNNLQRTTFKKRPESWVVLVGQFPLVQLVQVLVGPGSSGFGRLFDTDPCWSWKVQVLIPTVPNNLSPGYLDLGWSW